MIDWKKKIVLLGFGDTIAHPIKHPEGYGIIFYTSNKLITDMKKLVKKRKLELYFKDKEVIPVLIKQLSDFYDVLKKEESEIE